MMSICRMHLVLVAIALMTVGMAAGQTMRQTRLPRGNEIHIFHDLTRVEGEGDNVGWNLTIGFYNTPPQCVRVHTHLSIWREKDIFHPVNTGNEHIDWNALERMSFNGDTERPVNPQYFGYVVNDPTVNEDDLKVSMLEYEWSSDQPFTLFLPDFLFINMPLPPCPEGVENLPVKYYIAYETDYGDHHFESNHFVTPSVTYTMYVKENYANITYGDEEDLSGLFDEPATPHKPGDENPPIDDNEEPPTPDEEEGCIHQWVCEPARVIGTIPEVQILNGERCVVSYNIVQENARCTKCGITDPIGKWREATGINCEPGPEPPRPEVCPPHDWVSISSRFRIGHRRLRTQVPPFDNDSLVIDLSDGGKLRFDKFLERSDYSMEEGSGHSYFTSHSIHKGQTIREAQHFVEQLNNYATDTLGLHIFFSLPTRDEMQQFLTRRVTSGTPLSSGVFLVDSVQVEGTQVRIGLMNHRGEISMADIAEQHPEARFYIKATPYSSVRYRRVDNFVKLYFNHCRRCGLCTIKSRLLY
jgi:hypothetical protein